MTALGIIILRNQQEVSVKSLKSEIRDALRSDIEEQLIQRYEPMGMNDGKDYKAIVKYEPGKRTFKLTYDQTQDEGGAILKGFEFDELDDYLGIYGGKTYTAEIVSTYEGGKRKTRKLRRRQSKKRNQSRRE
jgi:hypothetical protein